MTALAEKNDAAPRSRLVPLLLLLILSLSAFIQFTTVSRTVVEMPLRADSGDYFSYAHNLYEYGVYSARRPTGAGEPAPKPDRLRSPGYPWFLAMMGEPSPDDAWLRQIALAQATFGVFSVLLAYLLARSYLGLGAALTAALLTAISPHLATISTYVLTESLFFFLLLASLLTLVRALASGKRRLYLATGLLWGLCSLVRPTTQFLPPLLLLATMLVPTLRAHRREALVAFACFALIMAPWLIRNRFVEWEPGSSLSVLSLLHGSYPGFMHDNQAQSFGFPYRHDPQAPAAAHDLGSVTRHIGRRAAEHPTRYLSWYLVGKPVYFLSWGNIQGPGDILIYPVLSSPWYEDSRFRWLWLLAYVLHWPLMILGLAGGLMAWLRPGWLGLGPRALLGARVVALVVAYAIAMHIVVAPFPRYGIPFRALLFALAMLPLQAGWLRLRRIAPSEAPA